MSPWSAVNKKGHPEPSECPVHRRNLLGAENGVLRGFGDAEFDDPLGGDVDAFSRHRIPTDTGFAVHEDQLAEAGQRESVFGVLVSESGLLIQKLHRLFLGDANLLGQDGCDLRF